MFFESTIKATIETNGSLIIKAYTGNEVVTLKTTSTTKQTYPMEQAIQNSDLCFDRCQGTDFSSGIGIGNGQIVITEYDTVNNTISGTFKFNLENIFNNPLSGATLNFQQGVFTRCLLLFPAVAK
jgi:hypothetical protein